MVRWCSSASEPTIVSIFQDPHAQRPIRGLPGGALCFSRVDAGAVGRLECHRLVSAADWTSRCAGSALALGHVADSHRFVWCMGLCSCLELGPITARHAGLGCVASTGRGRSRARCLALAKQGPRPGHAFARIAACPGSSRPRVAPYADGQRKRPLDLGGAQPRPGALERPAPGFGIERHLTVSSTPWVIFPRA